MVCFSHTVLALNARMMTSYSKFSSPYILMMPTSFHSLPSLPLLSSCTSCFHSSPASSPLSFSKTAQWRLLSNYLRQTKIFPLFPSPSLRPQIKRIIQGLSGIAETTNRSRSGILERSSMAAPAEGIHIASANHSES